MPLGPERHVCADQATRRTKTLRRCRTVLRQFAPGANTVIRNPETHDNEPLSEQAALERLATLSVLAHFVDHCEVDHRTKSDR